MALTEQVILEIRGAEAQLSQLESRLDSLSAPVSIPVEIEGQQALFDLDRQLDSIATVIEVPVDIDSEAAVAEARRDFEELQRTISSGSATASGLEREFRLISAALNISEDEARELARQVGVAEIQATQLDEAMRDVGRAMGLSEREAADLARQMNRVEAETEEAAAASGLFQSRLVRLRTLLATLVVGVGFREIVQQFNAAVTAASDLEQSIGGVGAIFGSSADEVIRFGQGAADAVGLTANAANQLASQIGAQLQSFGFSVEDSATKTTELIELGADLAATFGGPVSQAVEAIGSLLRGEINPIERYGVAVNQAAITANALEEGLVTSAGAMDIQAKALSGLDLLFEQTAGAQGQFAREADTTAGALERLRAEAGNAQAEIGEALVPAFEQLLEAAPDLIAALVEAGPALGDLAEEFIALGVEAAGIIEPLLGVVSILNDAAGVGQQDIAASLTEGMSDFDRTLSEIDRHVGASEFLSLVTGGLVGGRTLASDLTFIEGALNDVEDALAEGANPAAAFAEGFANINARVPITSAVLDALIQSAAIAGPTLGASLQSIAANADALGLTADELEAVNLALRALIEQGDLSGISQTFTQMREQAATTSDVFDDLRGSLDAVFDPNAAQGALSERFGDLPVVVQDLESLQGALDSAGITLQEFLDTGAGDSNIVAVFTEAETEILGVIASIEEAVPALRETLLGAFDVPVDEETDKITGDIDTFLQSLEEQAGAAAELEFDLSQIQVVAPDLAQLLADAGLEASDIAAAFAADLDAAATAEALIAGAEGMAATVAESYAEFLKTLTPQQTADLGVFAAENFVSNAIRTQLADTAEELAEVLSDALGTQTIAPELTIDLSNSQITGVLNLGQVPVNGGFGDTPGTGTATPGPSGPGGARAQSAPVSVTINNPVVVDESTAGAQAAQQLAATSFLLSARIN